MTPKRPLLMTAAIGMILLGCAHAQAQRFARPAPGVSVDVSVFYDALAPYGDWTEVSPYGWVWAPRGMVAEWRPYSTGHWEYTEYGWTWEDDYEWGWAPYHYGRWATVDSIGWVWVPDTEWAPAWVEWRWGEGWAGWAPLPPAVRWGVGVSVGSADVHWEVGLSAASWCFVETRYLLHPHLHTVILAPHRNHGLFAHTHNVTRYSYSGDHVVNHGFEVREVERGTGARVVFRSTAGRQPAPRIIRPTHYGEPGHSYATPVRREPFRAAPRDVPRGRPHRVR